MILLWGIAMVSLRVDSFYYLNHLYFYLDIAWSYSELWWSYQLVVLSTPQNPPNGAPAALRALLGLFEAGLYPGIVFYISRWVRHLPLNSKLKFNLIFIVGISGRRWALGLPFFSPRQPSPVHLVRSISE